MKNLIYISAASLVLVACGGEKTSLDKLKKEKESLQKELAEVSTKLNEVDGKIKELDSTQVKALPKVSTIQVEKTLFEHYFEVQGAVTANKNVMVLPEVGGIIRSLRVTDGQTINKGDVIATFDSDIIAGNEKELEEQLKVAEYMYEKQKTLYDKGVGTELAYKQAEGQYLSLKETLNTLKTRQGKFVLTAPFTGYVEKVFPVVGQLAGPSTPIIQLVDLKDMKVTAEISESYLGDIAAGSNVVLNFPAIHFESKNEKISRIGKFVNPVNRTITVDVDIKDQTNKNQNIIPNLMAEIKVNDYMDSAAYVLPTRVILKNSQNKMYVYILNGSVAEEKVIEVGRSYKGKTEILSGLEPGEKVIDRGSRSIINGQEVEEDNTLK